MTYASLITHVRDDECARARLDAALDLAARFKAKLVGVGAETYPAIALTGEAAMVAAGSGYAVVEATKADLAAAHTLFKSVALGAEANDWREAVGDPAHVVAREARGADLVVATSGLRGGDFDASAEDLVMLSGRPVLVLPKGGRAPSGRSVLVAWKDTREARRAVADALPFLMAADSVAVVEIAGEADRDLAAARVKDVCRNLARHGVEAHAHVRPRRSTGVAESLLGIADEHEADLLVSGAYGHSRLSEWVFGGVTQALLGACDRSLLLSH